MVRIKEALYFIKAIYGQEQQKIQPAAEAPDPKVDALHAEQKKGPIDL